MQEELIAHLREKYNPDAIILHGSRARGKEREHSDWDFIFLYNNATDFKSGRELYQNQNIEFSVHTLPVQDIESEFSTKLQKAKVLYETAAEGTTLLSEAISFYEKGVHWSEGKKNNHKLWLQGRINGMRDNIDNPVLFFKYFADLYPRVFNYWYWFIQEAHSQPIYIAMEEIAEKDPQYSQSMERLASLDISPAEKVSSAAEIYERLFGERF